MIKLMPVVAIGALVFAVGCSKSQPANQPAPVVAPAPSVEVQAGPAEKDLPAALDLALYPGAKVTKNRMSSSGGQKGYHVTLETSDQPSKVETFYSSQGIPGAAKGDQAQNMGETKHGNLVIINTSKKGSVSEIEIKVSPSGGHG